MAAPRVPYDRARRQFVVFGHCSAGGFASAWGLVEFAKSPVERRSRCPRATGSKKHLWLPRRCRRTVHAPMARRAVVRL